MQHFDNTVADSYDAEKILEKQVHRLYNLSFEEFIPREEFRA
jgi:hypothetical protein